MATMLIAVSTLVLIVIAVGLVYKKRPAIHIPVMMLAFLMDLGLLLYIELNRHAVENLLGERIYAPAENSLLLFHVAISTLMLVLYLILIVSGIQLYKKMRPTRNLHRNAAALFVGCRLLNYITSFFIT